MIGTTLLNYRIVAHLGAGGLGTVYAAEHVIIGRRAALKILKPEVASDETMVQRFLVEARSVAAIRHPNIVDVTDYGQANGNFVIVMELLDGETLAARLEREGMLEESTVKSLLVQLSSALAAAHERKIVHRDLKPENVFITSFPEYPDFVKVLDFGIAKLLGQGGALKTSPGLIIGTPAYMSPEQCMGDESLDTRSDVYSLGVVAYRMTTGSLPYQGNVMQQMQGHLMGTPRPVRELNPRISPSLEQVIHRCLARQVTDRFQTMHELREAVASLGGKAPLAFSAAEAAPRPTTGAAASTAPLAPPTAPIAPPAPVSRSAPTVSSGQKHDTRVIDTQRTEDFERAQAVAVSVRMREIISKRLQSDSLKLPALPEVAVKALQLAHDGDTTFMALARVIERDPFITSRILRMANSPFYGGLARIVSIEGAVARLGIKALVGVLQELAAEQVFTSRDPVIRNTFRGIWEHCLGVAHVSRDLAGLVKTVGPDPAYLAGLFHDIGKPVVAAMLLEAERAAGHSTAWMSGGVWRRVIEEIHRDVGAIIAIKWYLPREVATAVAELDYYDLKRGKTSPANVVRLANALCQREGLDVKASSELELSHIIVQGQQVLSVSDEQLAQVTNGLVQKVQALTDQRGSEPEGGSTRVFDRAAVL